MKRAFVATCLLPLITFIASASAQSAATPPPPHDKLLREIYQELIEINITDSVGDCTQASEKIYQSFQLEVTNKGGHSSAPVKDNAIYQLADGLSRIAKFEFPFKLSGAT